MHEGVGPPSRRSNNSRKVLEASVEISIAKIVSFSVVDKNETVEMTNKPVLGGARAAANCSSLTPSSPLCLGELDSGLNSRQLCADQVQFG